MIHQGYLAVDSINCNDMTCWCHTMSLAVDPQQVRDPLEVKLEREIVNHPQHYGGDTVYEVIKVLEAWLSPAEFVGFLKGNIIKYTARAAKKGNAGVDADKAAWYGAYLADYLKRKNVKTEDIHCAHVSA